VKRYICIHGHFYQPPRENPWLESLEIQEEAYPYHDWNERITAECYAPNTASRILDPERRIIDIVNNYAKISFNFGPTLLSWMEVNNPEVYEAIILADKESRRIFSGHGAALAQPYNHMIMPLASTRDKRTQILWGIRDFESRFERKPEGMWLPETAVDLETLDIMAEFGITFTILAPHQAERVRRLSDNEWSDVSDSGVDPKIPYICRLSSGRNINIFFYDGPISRDVAFGGLLTSGENFANRLMGAFTGKGGTPQLVNIATDGETYGHHQRFGDMALAYCLYQIETDKLASITIYGEYLEKFPPTHVVEIIENSSWSCGHGIERWRSDCGCNSGMGPGWHQNWRRPLREALDWLRDALTPYFEEETSRYLKDPWLARDEYFDVMFDRTKLNVERFLMKHGSEKLSRKEQVRVLKLLEMQRHAMLMYTSCGWFFDEISGIETVQVIEYASRAIQLCGEVNGVDLEGKFTELLREAPSNLPEYENGSRVMEALVKPAIVDLTRVGAHYAISSLFEEYPEILKIFCYTNYLEEYDLTEAGRQKLAVGKSRIFSDITWEEETVSFAVVQLGDHNLFGGVWKFDGDESFGLMNQEIKTAFLRSDVTQLFKLIAKHFGSRHYSLWHLFRDEQQKILNQILLSTLDDMEGSFRHIYEDQYPIMQVMREVQMPLPKVLADTMEFIFNLDLRKVIENEELDIERLQKLVEEVERWSFEPDRTTLSFVASRKIHALMEKIDENPEEASRIEILESTLGVLSKLALELDLWKSQNIYFSVGKRLYGKMKEQSDRGEQTAKRWIDLFHSLGDYLQVRIV
jgi:alpha-amylase/alpha-mannosidase (GH57 family)